LKYYEVIVADNYCMQFNVEKLRQGIDRPTRGCQGQVSATASARLVSDPVQLRADGSPVRPRNHGTGDPVPRCRARLTWPLRSPKRHDWQTPGCCCHPLSRLRALTGYSARRACRKELHRGCIEAADLQGAAASVTSGAVTTVPIAPTHRRGLEARRGPGKASDNASDNGARQRRTGRDVLRHCTRPGLR